MCVVSNVGDYFGKRFPHDYPDWFPPPITPAPMPIVTPIIPPGVSKQEFDKLKKQVEEMRELLKKAKAIDEATEQPSCEKEEKVAMLKKLAELVGVDLGEVFNAPPTK